MLVHKLVSISNNSELVMKSQSILVIGHWMVDRILQVPKGILLKNPLPTQHLHVPILTQPGGSGYHFSLAAKKAGFRPVYAVICVGRDTPGRILTDTAYKSEVFVISHKSKIGTGEAFLIYDTNGRRASFGTRQANLELPDFTLQVLKKLRPKNVFVAGHVLEDRTRLEKVVEFLSVLKDYGCFTVFDVVPHDIQKKISSKTRTAIANSVSGIIGTRNALIPFLSDDSMNDQSDLDIVNDLLENFEWVCLHPDNDKLIIGERNGRKTRTHQIATHYKDSKIKAGALDKSVARELYNHAIRRWRLQINNGQGVE